MPSVMVTLPISRSSRTNTPTNDLSHLDEEIIAQNGDVEEIFAIDTTGSALAVASIVVIVGSDQSLQTFAKIDEDNRVFDGNKGRAM